MSSSELEAGKPGTPLLAALLRTPALLLVTGTALYGFICWLAPGNDPMDFSHVIGGGALIATALIELAIRKWRNRGEKNDG